jgi:hypothetical protein
MDDTAARGKSWVDATMIQVQWAYTSRIDAGRGLDRLKPLFASKAWITVL